MSSPPEALETLAPASPEPPARPATSFWGAVREAVHGAHHHDYTQGSIRRAIFLLAVPMVLEMIMESVFAVVDVFFVGRLGADAVATVGLTESMLALVYALAMGLSMGAGATVARRIGEKDPEGAARAAVQALAIALAFSLVLGVAGAIAAPHLLALMGASPSVVATGSGYTRIMLGGQVVIVMLFVANAVFRGAGDAAIAMRVLWIANAINIVLGPCFIFGLGPFPELGVTGAAVATTIGRGTGAGIALWRMTRPNARVVVTRRHLRLRPELMRQIGRIAGSGAFQAFVGVASWIGLVRILSSFGSEVLAGYTIAMRVVMFALLPSWGVSNAAATMVGQSLGARDPRRAERAVWLAGFYNMWVLGAVGLVFVLFAPAIVGLFTADPDVMRYGADCLRVVAAGFLFYAYGMVLTQAFNGAGDTWTPTLINLGVFWLFEIPLAWTLARTTGLGPHGVFLAITIAFSTLAVVSALLFRRGKWKEKRV